MHATAATLFSVEREVETGGEEAQKGLGGRGKEKSLLEVKETAEVL